MVQAPPYDECLDLDLSWIPAPGSTGTLVLRSEADPDQVLDEGDIQPHQAGHIVVGGAFITLAALCRAVDRVPSASVPKPRKKSGPLPARQAVRHITRARQRAARLIMAR